MNDRNGTPGTACETVVAGTDPCTNCPARTFCLTAPIAGSDLTACRRLVKRQRRIGTGGLLLRAGDRADTLHIVRSGTFMRYCIDPDGGEHVLGFVMAGEPLDIDELSVERRVAYAEALEPATVCEVPVDGLESLLRAVGGNATALVGAIQHQMWRDRRRECLMSRGHARIRLARFLHELAGQVAERGGDGTDLELAMPRRNIASYLGLTIETVSRSLTAMQRAGEIDVRGRRIRLNSVESNPAVA